MGTSELIKRALSAYTGHILRALVRLRGLKALLLAYGVAGCRYVEYSMALCWLKALKAKRRSEPLVVLDVGSGHSIFPCILKEMGVLCVVLDVDEECVKWQRRRLGVEGVVASATHLPFRPGSLDAVTAISTVEHIPGGDERAMMEMGKALKPCGLAVVSVPFSLRPFAITDPMYGIPGFLRRLGGPLKAILLRFGADVSGPFYMRYYDQEAINDDLVRPSGAELKASLFFGGPPMPFYKLVPMGAFTWLELVISRLVKVMDRPIPQSDGVVLVLSKGRPLGAEPL